MQVLLVEPRKAKTWGRNNQYVGLLRIGHYHQEMGDKVEYILYPNYATIAPDLIYVTSMFTYWYPYVWEAVRHYKALYPSATVMLGGIYATICPEHAKQSGADEVVVGQHPEAYHYAPDPSLLPYKQDFAYLFTSYGCNRSCTYCATHIIYGEGIHQLPVEQVVNEIKYLKSKGFNTILIGDDNILYDAEGHINQICEELIRRKIKVELHIPGGMSAKDFTQETANLMAQAGFREISFALESVSPEVRRMMGRATNATEDDLEVALSYADKAGFSRIATNVYFIIGLPYQKMDDMVDTLCYLINLGVWAHPQRLTPIPNTVDWKRMSLEDWDYVDLEYKTFVAPGQDNFTSEDLDVIYDIARFFNMGLRYTGYNWLDSHSSICDTFIEKMVSERLRRKVTIPDWF